MKKDRQNVLSLQLAAVFLIIFILSAFPVSATTHTIIFGGQVGFAYAPNQLSVAVGDTVVWSGPFIGHPLSSTSVPQGANTFSCSTGTSFAYPVQVAGTYNYKCDVHAGMVGSFTAGVAGVSQSEVDLQPGSFQLAQNYPNPFNARTVIQFNLPVAQHVKLRIFSLTGAEIATLLDGYMPAGEITVPFEAGNLASGVYFYQLVTEKFINTKRLVLSK